MAETPLTDSIEALTTYANQVTGASDTNLSDAVYTLAQGYGSGGSALFERGEITIESDVTAANFYIPHSLGVAPDFVIVQSNVLPGQAPGNMGYIAGASAIGFIFGTTTRFYEAYFRALADSYSSISEYIDTSKFLNKDWIRIPYYNSNELLKGGATYQYIIGKIAE